MTFSVTTPATGRGSFATNAQLGGTLNAKGDGPGPYYRAPTGRSGMPGLIGALAVRNGVPVSANDYAVHMAVLALQPHFGLTSSQVDGILGPQSDGAIRSYQKWNGLIVDGVVGPKTCRTIFEPLVRKAVDAKYAGIRAQDLIMVTTGTITLESGGWDPGAVGESSPEDLGIGQINEVHSANPAGPYYISTRDRLIPSKAIPWIVDFIGRNFVAMNGHLDDSIVAYNLGVGGAQAWRAAGRPASFRGAFPLDYIARVKAA